MKTAKQDHTTTDLTRKGSPSVAQDATRGILRLAQATVLVIAAPMIVAATTPVMTESEKVYPADVAVNFGKSVAVWGNTAVIGDPDNDLNGNDSGAAWVFVRDGSAWVELIRLAPSDASVDDHFGASVDIYDDFIVVGAPWAEGAGATTSGSAYVFRWDGMAWIEHAKLVGAATVLDDPWDGPRSGDLFGHSVAINGDIPADSTNNDIWHNIIVGSPGDSHSQEAGAGSAYLYQLSPDGAVWNPMGKIYSDNPFYADNFGVSVDIDGDHLIVGANKDEESLSIGDCGAAYIWVRRNMDGTWNLEARIGAGDPGVHDHFGSSVAVNAIGGLATFVVGAEDDDDLGFDSGSVYVFVGSASTFPQLVKLVASDGADYDRFGSSVAVNRDLMLIGAPQAGSPDDGAVYVISRLGYTWAESHRLNASDDTGLGERFGTSVAVTGELGLVGSTSAHGSVSYGGAVYEYDDLIDDIFSDGFESGNTDAWSATSP